MCVHPFIIISMRYNHLVLDYHLDQKIENQEYLKKFLVDQIN